MSRRSGNKMKRVLGRLFKERQIYHRSDGVVHFISMSAKTQVALAIVALAALLWVAYSSVNVVFKEQIIVAKEQERLVLQTNLSKRLTDAKRAYDDVSYLNNTIEREFDQTMDDIWSRHRALSNMVERKASVDQGLLEQASNLSAAGGPNGQQPTNANRVMIDITPGEPTPRQSRISVLKKEAALESSMRRQRFQNENLAADAIDSMEKASAELYAEQILLLASVEEKATRQIDDLERVISSTGISASNILTPAKISNVMLAQGGPFIEPGQENSVQSRFFTHANRTAAKIDKLAAMQKAVSHLPLSSPLTVTRRFTSGFGIRRDPINGRHSSHHGIDFAAPWASPVTATGIGIVKYAGTRSGWGRMVEIDHGNGFVTRYAHMSRITVKAGQKVKLHDKVGELGSSGRSTGPHVHYEILFRNRPVNPRRFIEAGRYVFES
ncbi:MAG: peptidase M23 [Hyphococcus sp.]|nr:MAG: peptidase M23 [Marinicaulis sp.]